jgi:hypothetical protein
MNEVRTLEERLRDAAASNPNEWHWPEDLLAEAAAELERVKHSARIAISNLAEVCEQRDALAKTLSGCLDLVTHLMGDLTAAGVTPSMVAVVAKAKLDAEMRQILARYGASLPTQEEQGK